MVERREAGFMADLLECLLQIKALKETPGRLAALLNDVPRDAWVHRPAPGAWAPVEVLAHLADLELAYGVRLRLMLTSDRPALPRFDQNRLAERAHYLAWPPQLALERFRVRRGDSLEILEGSGAEELARIGIHPTRGEMTVADMVALMLAHDTGHVGQIRQRLARADAAASPPAAPSARDEHR
jgi:uncharacterized damage-inducible protein DinB